MASRLKLLVLTSLALGSIIFFSGEPDQEKLGCAELRLLDEELDNIFMLINFRSLVMMPGRSKNILSLANRNKELDQGKPINLKQVFESQFLSESSKDHLDEILRYQIESKSTDLGSLLLAKHKEVKTNIHKNC